MRRLASLAVVVWAAATAAFFLVRLAPGGPFDDERAARPEVRESLEKHFGLDRPMWEQYAAFLGNLARGDLGPSFRYPGRSVNEMILEALPVSAELGFWALAFALASGVGLGICAALGKGTPRDAGVMAASAAGICLPTFVLGPILILVFALRLGWVNSSGWDGAGDRILPAVTLGAAYAAYLARLTRSGLLDVLGQAFVRTATAKGAAFSTVLWRHAMPLAAGPVVSYLGPAVAGLLTGSFVVETVFQIPGLGRYFVLAALNRDYTLVLGLVIFYAALVGILNLVVDLAQAALDPRVRHG